MPTKEPGSWLPWIFVVILGAMLYQQTPKVEPQPDKPKVEKVVAKMMADTTQGYAKEFEKAAASVGNGEIKNEEQLHKQLKDALDAVRTQASSDLNALMDSNIPTEWSDGNAVSTFLRSVASGFK
jgi:hypothetical protein